MNDRSPRLVSRLRIFVPLAALALILAGASAAFASGAFESNDSGFDSARDVAERGAAAATTTSTSLPDANDDKGVDATPPAQAPSADQRAHDAVASDDGRDDNSGPGNVSDDRSTDDNSGPGNVDDSNSGHSSSNSGHGSSSHSSDG